MEQSLQDLIEEASNIFDSINDPIVCESKGRVLNAYCSLCKCGVGHCEAIKIASRLLKLNRPCNSDEAKTLVECWVFQNSNQSVN